MMCDISKGVEPVEIREATRLVIKRGNEYLVGLIIGGPDLRWSLSAYDAWWDEEPGRGADGRQEDRRRRVAVQSRGRSAAGEHI